MSVLSKPWFHDETEAFAYLEGLLWPNGPVCPHCGATDRIYPLQGKTHRMGLKKCGHCRKQFTVKVGTVCESSHVPLTKWLQAMHLLCCSKKGISSHQLHRLLGVTYKTAWFMAHRIREGMRDGTLGPLGGMGCTVEADEATTAKRTILPSVADPASVVRSANARSSAWWSAAAGSAPSTSTRPTKRRSKASSARTSIARRR
jgi:transposase-like protein